MRTEQASRREARPRQEVLLLLGRQAGYLDFMLSPEVSVFVTLFSFWESCSSLILSRFLFVSLFLNLILSFLFFRN